MHPSKETLQDIPELDEGKAKVLGRGLRAERGVRMPLRALRVAAGKTQVEVAQAVETDQGEISRIERRDDALVSTLRRYARALGGELEIAVVFDGKRRIIIEM
ncbi:MAG: helix-turn-helix domain-containing protein [Deltaproteobacteria bacterium]|nr:helix-turn-helix domain-containing protein [Deltaproteobacteria bacterium]